MLEMLLCSLVTLSPDYPYRRYVQGKAVRQRSTAGIDIQPMSALGHLPTYAAQKGMSALPPIATVKADI